MLEMFKGVANSPETTITNNISNSDTLIYVLDETRIPEPPNLMVLGTGVGAETIKVLSIDGNAITVERGFQGVAKAWNAGTIIARNFTEYDYNALVENVRTLKENTDTNSDDILDLMSYVGDLESLDTVEKSNIVLALNEIYQGLTTHKAEIASKHIYESGQNGNGRYIKFDDGTMICTAYKTYNETPISTEWGNLFESGNLNWIYPANFVGDRPGISVSNNNTQTYSFVATTIINLNALDFKLISGTSRGSVNRIVSLMAVGRWK